MKQAEHGQRSPSISKLSLRYHDSPCVLLQVLPYSLKVFGAQNRQALLRAMQVRFCVKPLSALSVDVVMNYSAGSRSSETAPIVRCPPSIALLLLLLFEVTVPTHVSTGCAHRHNFSEGRHR